jgi:heptosyltransferase-3
MEYLRADYTEVWAAARNVPLARFADHAASIVSMGLDRVGLLPAEDVIHRLREFDEVVSWYGANRQEFRELMEFRFLEALPGGGEHATDFYLRQVGAEPGAAPQIDCPRQNGGYAIIHPFASSASKRWPLERFEELAKRLSKRMPVRWCCGPEEEYPGAARIQNLYELGCWIAGGRVFIGNDSGISHLAAAVGTPAVALFGPTDPAVWAPRGPSVQVIAKASIAEITVDEVEAAIGYPA